MTDFQASEMDVESEPVSVGLQRVKFDNHSLVTQKYVAVNKLVSLLEPIVERHGCATIFLIRIGEILAYLS
jgi:hypothetical protein